jgi:hypothetical protein
MNKMSEITASSDSMNDLPRSMVGEEADHNPIFEALVSTEGEISGLVAYSLYKQNKRDWLQEFRKQLGRLPDESETRSYIIGESTARRLATYRQLAQSTLGTDSGGVTVARRTVPMSGVLWTVLILAALAILGYGLHVSGVVGPR